jgi:hypothetical protein
MKRISLLIAISFLMFLPGFSQAQLAVLRDNGTGNPILTNAYREVKGSPYFEEFKMGTILLPNGQTVEGLQIALNAFENTMEYKLEGTLFSYAPEKIAGFKYDSESGEKVEFTSEFTIPTLGKKRFMRVLEKGKYTLLHHQYKLMMDDVSATYGAQAAKAFQNQEEFFIVKDGSVYLFKNKSKDLQQIFGEDAARANSIIKEQKLNLKSQADISRLIRQLN